MVRIGPLRLPGGQTHHEVTEYSLTDLRSPLEWSRHDQTHLEITVGYNTADSEDGVLEWDAYYFIPETFHLNADTYSKRQIFADLRSYVRLAAPRLKFNEVALEAKHLRAEVPGLDPDDAVCELKLFGSRVHRSIIDVSNSVKAKILASKTGNPDDIVEAFVVSVCTIKDETHRVLKTIAATDGAHRDVCQAATWIDEYISRSVERAFIRMASHEGGQDNGGRGPASTAAIEEARRRYKATRGTEASAGGSTTDLERVERRHHSLKRFVSSVLWLNVEVRQANQWAEHILHAVAAGIAMSFAVVAAVSYGNPSDTNRLWVWGLLVVVAYMAKDRIKVMLQRRFDAAIDRCFNDRHWMIRTENQTSVLAEISEKARFIDRDDLPSGVAEIRTRAYRDTLQELAAPDSILHHHKQIRLHTDAISGHDPRYVSLIEIARMDISRWLTHTDDAKRRVTLVDPERKELFTSKLPRAYDVIAVYRLCRPSDTGAEWNAVRFVVSRSGIRRVGEIDAIKKP